MKRKTNIHFVTASVFIASFLTAIEGTIVTTAMPTIIGTLHGMEIMNWVFSIYLLTSAMVTPIYGKLADIVGRKPIFIIGTLVFAVGSSLCGLSNSMTALIISRAIQGIGAGAIMPVSLIIIADLYPVEKRARVIGLNNASWGIASVLGPLAGGIIVDTIGWHWIFFINVPVGLLVIFLTVFFLFEPHTKEKAEKMDLAGTAVLMLVLTCLLLGFQEMGDNGLSFLVLALLTASAVFIFLFIRIERKAGDPIIELKLFSSRLFVASNIVAALLSGFLISLDVYIPVWMQGVLGMSAGLGGLALAPLSLLWMPGSFLAGRWMEKMPVQRVMMIGLLISLFGGVSLFLTPQKGSYIWFLFVSGVLGIGLGLTITTSTVSAQSSVDAHLLGIATSFNTLIRTIAQTVMISLFGIIINTSTASGLLASGIAGDGDVMNQLVNPQTARFLSEDVIEPLRKILFSGLHKVYFTGVIMIILSIFSVFMFNRREKMVG